MKTKRKKAQKESTNLSQALENGEPITGMIGYVPFKGCCNDRDEESEVYIKVKILGFKTETEGSCGVGIEVEPVSGAGTFSITPCQWLDKPADIAKLKDQKARELLADDDYRQITGPSYVRVRKSNLLAYVDTHLTADQQADFRGQVEEMKSSPDLRGLSDQDVKWLATIVTYQVHGVERKPDRNNYRYN